MPEDRESRNLPAVPKARSARRASVCLYAFHPLVLSEFGRLLSEDSFAVLSRRLEPDLLADPSKLVVPKASVYVMEAHAHRPTTEAMVVGVLTRVPAGRVVVVSEKLDQSNTFPLLRLGVKGMLTFSQASEQLARAVQEVAAGGFWVPRTLLSRFVDEALGSVRRPRGPAGPARLSAREREVLDALLLNLSNKEIASKLHMSERTAKFHVSNLLAKYGVRRRADLILLTYTQLERT